MSLGTRFVIPRVDTSLFSLVGELAVLIKEIVGYAGQLEFNTRKPDGMPLKALDSTLLSQLGWRPKTEFRSALLATYNLFLNEYVPHGDRWVILIDIFDFRLEIGEIGDWKLEIGEIGGLS